jgi:HEAT repeat protein
LTARLSLLLACFHLSAACERVTHQRADARQPQSTRDAALGSDGATRCTGSAAAIPRLICEVKTAEKPAAVRAALSGLIAKKERAVGPLIAHLGDPSERNQTLIAHALAKIGPAAITALRSTLSHKTPRTREGATVALMFMGEQAAAAIPEIRALLVADPDATVRIAAASALTKMGAAAIPVLSACLSHDSADVRKLAAESLGELQPLPAEVLAALARRLHDTDWRVRLMAAGALEQAKKRGVPHLRKALKAKLGDTREAAIGALGDIGPDAAAAIPDLVKLLQNPRTKTHLRSRVAHALGKIGGQGIASLRRALIRGDFVTRSMVCVALAKSGAEGVAILVAALEHRRAPVRLAAATGLSHAGAAARSAIPLLRRALKDADAGVRYAAGEALARIERK